MTNKELRRRLELAGQTKRDLPELVRFAVLDNIPIAEIARLTGLSRTTIYRYLGAGEGPTRR